MAIDPRVTRARGRLVVGARRRNVRIEYFIKELSDKIAFTMSVRMRTVVEMLHSRVLLNIRRPVTKTTGPRGGKVVTDRSKPGEYPKSETVQLMRTLGSRVIRPKRNVIVGMVGTPLDYGAILEFSKKLNRNWLGRTLRENSGDVIRILTGPIK